LKFDDAIKTAFKASNLKCEGREERREERREKRREKRDLT